MAAVSTQCRMAVQSMSGSSCVRARAAHQLASLLRNGYFMLQIYIAVDPTLYMYVQMVTQCCIHACAGGMALHGIVQDLLQAFEAEVPPHLAQHQDRRSQLHITPTQPKAKVGWQGRAAASVVALTEVLYGASPAWQAAHGHSLIRTAATDSKPSTRHGAAAAHDLSPSNSASEHSEPNDSLSTHAANGSSPASHDSMRDSSLSSSVGSRTSSRGSPQGELVSDSLDGHSPLKESDATGQQQLSGTLKQQRKDLERLVEQAVDSFGNSGAWQVPTHADPDAAQDGIGPLTPQV